MMNKNTYVLFANETDKNDKSVRILSLEKDGKGNKHVSDFHLIMEEFSYIDAPVRLLFLTDGELIQLLVDNKDTYRYAFVNKENVEKMMGIRQDFINKHENDEDTFDGVLQTVYEDEEYHDAIRPIVFSSNMFVDVPTSKVFESIFHNQSDML